jgi:DNA gyrase/topoisomerase IV subunit B
MCSRDLEGRKKKTVMYIGDHDREVCTTRYEVVDNSIDKSLADSATQ